MASVGLRFVHCIGIPAASGLRLVIPLNVCPEPDPTVAGYPPCRGRDKRMRDALVAVWCIWRRQDPHPATHVSDPYG
jgi:hypothetical protein